MRPDQIRLIQSVFASQRGWQWLLFYLLPPVEGAVIGCCCGTSWQHRADPDRGSHKSVFSWVRLQTCDLIDGVIQVVSAAAQILQIVQQHLQMVQGRRRVAALEVVVQPMDQLAQLRVIQAQHCGGLKLVPMTIHSVVQDTGILQPLLICAILWGEKCFYILFELVRVAARAGSFFLPGHKP